MNRGLIIPPIVVSLFLLPVTLSAQAQRACAPTSPDSEGPFYKPGAPLRESTGRGLVVSGVVRSAGSCAPIPGARIEWWQASPSGDYDNEHRGALRSGDDGAYRFVTDFPSAYFSAYFSRPPHIHLKVFAPGHRPLTTQLYPKAGQTQILLDLVPVKP